jgi:hypothetical protein
MEPMLLSRVVLTPPLSPRLMQPMAQHFVGHVDSPALQAHILQPFEPSLLAKGFTRRVISPITPSRLTSHFASHDVLAQRRMARCASLRRCS